MHWNPNQSASNKQEVQGLKKSTVLLVIDEDARVLVPVLLLRAEVWVGMGEPVKLRQVHQLSYT